jgi:hypothetical protein
MQTINNISELRTRKGSTGVKVSVNGLVSFNDGKGGEYFWDATSTDADNNSTIIAVNTVATGRWKKVNSDLALTGGTLTGNLTLSPSNINTRRVATYADLTALVALNSYTGIVLVNSDSTNANAATVYLVYNNLVFWIPSQTN